MEVNLFHSDNALFRVSQELYNYVELTLAKKDRQLQEATDEQLGTLLCRCIEEHIPESLLQEILSVRNGIALQYHNAYNQNCLHVCAMQPPHVPKLQLLLRQANARSLVQSRDHNYLRPLDSIAQKIIVTEEAKRWGKDIHGELDTLWEMVRLLVLCDLDLSDDSTSPTLHILLRARDIPISLMDGALRTFRCDLEKPDDRGNLPLHYAAMRPYSEDDDFLQTVLKRRRDVAGHVNHEGDTPLGLAIEAGRRLESGCRALAQAAPETLPDVKRSQTLVVIQELQRRNEYDLLYILLQHHFILEPF